MANAMLRREKVSTAGVLSDIGGKFIRKASYVFLGEIFTHFSAFDDDVKIGYDMVNFEFMDEGRYAGGDSFFSRSEMVGVNQQS